MPEVNWFAIVAAALSSLLVGFLWYSPALFNKPWMREVGMTEEKARSSNMALIFGGAFVLALVQCAVLAMLVSGESWQMAVCYSFLTGLAWVATAFGVQYLFERRGWTLFLINGGYNVVAFTVYGLILGLWR